MLIYVNNTFDIYHLLKVNKLRTELEIKEKIKVCKNTIQYVQKDEKKKIEGELRALKWVLGENP